MSDKKLSSNDISERMAALMAERARQDAEFRAAHPQQQKVPVQFLQEQEKPLSSEEIDARMQAMLAERARQDSEFRRKFKNE